MLSTLLRFVLALLLCTLPLTSQVPIDLSQAKEFKVVWKKPIGGRVFPIMYVPSVCSIEGFDVLCGSALERGRFTWKTRPKIDTNSLGGDLGIIPHLLDYDGVAPLEYVNHRGHILQCSGQDSYPFPFTPLDTVAGCSVNPEYSMDIDLDGHLDVVCDVGGGGYAARVVMGGPGAGKGCQRVFHIGRPPTTRHVRTLDAFFPSVRGGGLWHLLQWDKDTNAFYDVLTLWEVTIGRENGILTVRYEKVDSLIGHTTTVEGQSFGSSLGIADSASMRDWLLCYHLVPSQGNIAAVERFDLTDGRFVSTGEVVTGYTFITYFIENLGLSLGTSKHALALPSDYGYLFCYADNLAEPFARWITYQTGLQPVAGMVAINDQTGDGQPDLIVTGGGNNGMVALYTLDPAVGVFEDSLAGERLPCATLTGTELTVQLGLPVVIHAELVTTDGRSFPLLVPTPGQVGRNRYDLMSALESFPAGAYLVRVSMGAESTTLKVMR